MNRLAMGKFSPFFMCLLLAGCSTAAPPATATPTQATTPARTASATTAPTLQSTGPASAAAPTATPAPTATAAPTANAAPTATAAPSASHPTASSPSSLPVLEQEGRIPPGRYLFTVDNSSSYEADWAENERPASPLGIEVTLPVGFVFSPGFPVIEADTSNGSKGPDGGALALGWTSYWASLYSDPCFEVPDQVGDTRVGPTVDDFVDAVKAHPKLDVTDPTNVELGGYQGKFFSLTGPEDISRCDSWQPWDPAFYAQGEDNRWDVWVIDANGFRVMIVNEYFPGTPENIKSDLGEMVDSVRFVPEPVAD